jgi:hypothetical protein
MRSEKQIQAFRSNGARSRRPITTQGKRNSSRNNLRHGFSMHDSSLDHNPPAAFTNLKTRYMADFQLAAAQEIQLVHTSDQEATALTRACSALRADKPTCY